jgi:hypothetical protein
MGWHDVAAYIDDVRKVKQTVEEVWPEEAPEDVEKSIMDTLESLDSLILKLEEYL